MSDMMMPPTGLYGSEQALLGGSEAAMAALTRGYDHGQGALQQGWKLSQQAMTPVGPADMSGVNSAIGSGVQGVGGVLQPWQKPGLQALDVQAALSGAMGPQAQQAAYANFQTSPGQQYLQSRAEQALLRNSAALGGLGGGRVRQELQRQAIGEASQDFNNNFARLGQVAGIGANAAGQQAGQIGSLYGQQAGIAGNLESQRMGLQSAQNQTLAQLAGNFGTRASDNAMTAGGNAATIAAQTGRDVATGRYDTGVRLAGAAGDTTSALAGLINAQGQDIAGTIASGAGDLASIIAGAGTAQAGSQTELAKLLANILAGQGGNVGSLPGVPGVQQQGGQLGNIGDLLSGIGSLIPAPVPVGG